MSNANSDRMKAWRLANPERFKEHVRKSKAKRRANMTEEEKEAVRAEDRARRYRKRLAAGKRDDCEVCGSTSRIVLDHCHATKNVRGWICDDCNVALGRVHDNPETLRKLAEYLERHRGLDTK